MKRSDADDIRMDAARTRQSDAGEDETQTAGTYDETRTAGTYEARLADSATSAEEIRMPVAEEQLVVQKRTVTLGAVHVRKWVETSEQSMSVPYFHDEVIVEHLSPDQFDPHAPADPDVTIIPIMEEQVIVEKRQVVKEYLRIRTNRVEQRQDVSETVRREVVEVSEQPAKGVSLEETPLAREVTAS